MVLKNTKHEHFVQLIVNGESAKQAYVSAGYSEKGAYSAASRLLKIVKVAARIEQLRTSVANNAAEKAAVDRTWVMDKLKAIVMRCLEKNENAANRALELLGKEIGMFVDRKDIRFIRRIEDLSNDELVALMADIEEKIAASQPTSDLTAPAHQERTTH